MLYWFQQKPSKLKIKVVQEKEDSLKISQQIYA